MSTKKRRGGYLATARGVQQLKEAKRVKKYTYQQIAEAARETEDKVKRLFNPQWGNGKYKVGEEAVEAICNVLDLKPEDIVTDWYAIKNQQKQAYQQAIDEIEQALINKKTVLELDNKGLTELPDILFNLTKLEKLYLHNNYLRKIPKQIQKLSNLEILSLGKNQLTELPKEIGTLANLRELHLSNNRLREIPEEIGNLTKLEVLYISSNYLKTLPVGIQNLSRLELIDLGNNELNTIIPYIGQLKNLNQLYAVDNRLTNIPVEIGQLTKLEKLHLNHNLLKSLPSEIGQLYNLEKLYLNHNRITNIPSEIGQLKKLKELYLGSNLLRNFPVEVERLENLEYLDLNDNHLSDISLKVKQLKNLKYLYLNKNINLPIPSEILDKYDRPQIIIDYYLSLPDNQQKPLHEAKMFLVGQGNVGKTSLRERLIQNQYDTTSNKTDGIDIEPWIIQVDDKELQVNIWDFGGQEIMHSTHQFFLTKRSLYLLVLDTTQSEEDNRIEYWLKIIQSFGKDAPVVIVGNKADQHPLDINKTGLQKKYPQVKGFYEISCETNEGISELSEFIKQEIIQLEHIELILPLPWFNVKAKIEKLDKDYISYEQYESLCEQEGVETEDNQRILIRLLNDLGIVLNFQDDPRLEDTLILNPEWVTNGVYKILNDRNLIVDNRGILSIKYLKLILNKPRYPLRKHLFIIGMMRKFELCFDIEPDKQFLIPDILPKEEPYTGEWDNSLAFEYHYPVLPGSIISRFIVRMNQWIYQHTYWRNGVVLAHEGNLALIKADREDKIIKIRVKGKVNTRRNLLTAIRSQFDYIHKTIPGIVPVAKVPLIDHPDIILDYQELLGLESMGEKDIAIGKLKQCLPLRQLLDGIDY